MYARTLINAFNTKSNQDCQIASEKERNELDKCAVKQQELSFFSKRELYNVQICYIIYPFLWYGESLYTTLHCL